MLRYTEHAPSPRFRAHVDRYWFLEGAGADVPEAVMPDGRMELVFHFGSRFHQHLRSGRVERQPHTLLVGQMQESVWLSHGSTVGCAGIRLQPAAAAALLRLPASEVSGQIVELSPVLPRAGETVDRLAAASTVDGRVRALEAFLDGLDLVVPSPVTTAAVSAIMRADGQLRISELAHIMGVERRRIERAFAHDVGLSPKAFARVIRFQRALALVRAGQPLAEAALACGYYDQAHMAADFRTLSVAPPVEFRGGAHARDLFAARLSP